MLTLKRAVATDRTGCALVIQGASDMGTRLSERELQQALDYCSTFVQPTSPEARVHVVRCGLPNDVFDVSMAPVDPKETKDMLDTTASVLGTPSDDTSTQVGHVRMAVEQANARRVVHQEYLVHNLEAEEINGFVVRLQRGSLGLSRVGRDGTP